MATTRASHKEVNNFGSMHIVEPWDPKYRPKFPTYFSNPTLTMV
jgi:hypothetical protein